MSESDRVWDDACRESPTPASVEAAALFDDNLVVRWKARGELNHQGGNRIAGNIYHICAAELERAEAARTCDRKAMADLVADMRREIDNYDDYIPIDKVSAWADELESMLTREGK